MIRFTHPPGRLSAIQRVSHFCQVFAGMTIFEFSRDYPVFTSLAVWLQFWLEGGNGDLIKY
jgi:hypothetical protein